MEVQARKSAFIFGCSSSYVVVCSAFQQRGAEHRLWATRRKLIIGLCIALMVFAASVAAALGVSLARLSSSSHSDSNSKPDATGGSSAPASADFGRAGAYEQQVGVVDVTPRDDGSWTDNSSGITSGSNVINGSHDGLPWSPAVVPLRNSIRIMRVGMRLETVVEHLLSGEAIRGKAGDASGVSVSGSREIETTSALGRDDPPQFPAAGAVLDSDGLLTVAVLGKNGAGLHLQSFQAEGFFWHSSGWETVDIPFRGGPALTTPDGQTCFVFIRGADDNLWFNAMQGSWLGVWNTVQGANATSAPAAVTERNQLHVFVRSSTGSLLHGRSPDRGATWGWSDLGGALREYSSPAATVSADGQSINIATRGKDSALWHLRLRNSVVDIPWRRIQTLGLISSSPALGFLNGELKVIVRGEDRTTFWEDSSADGGLSFEGAWRSWNQGFGSHPTAASYSSNPSKLVLLGVNKRGELAVLQRSSELQSSKWATLSSIPAGSDTRVPPRDDGQPATRGSTDNYEESSPCVPCETCAFYDNACWGRCNYSCSANAGCEFDEEYTRNAAALHACAYVWGACGAGAGAGSRVSMRSQSLAPSLATKVGGSNVAACRLKAEDFCEDSIWRVDLYEVKSTSHVGDSCGEIIFNGNGECSSAYAFSLFRALVPESCNVAVEKLFQEHVAGGLEEDVPGIPWQRPS